MRHQWKVVGFVHRQTKEHSKKPKTKTSSHLYYAITPSCTPVPKGTIDKITKKSMIFVIVGLANSRKIAHIKSV
jgi:hypothetical protein